MAVCPLSAAGILVHQAEGSAELKRLLRRVLEYRRIGWRWYLPIVFLNPAILLGSYRLMRWLGRPLPDPQVSLAAAPLLLLVFLPPAVGEVAGWMGYGADPLRDRLGTVGALWHVVPLVQAHHDIAWIAWNCLETLAARILIVAGGVPALEPLSDRERDVLHLLALGYTNHKIGRKPYVSERTIDTHRAHIMRKLRLETRAELVLFALANGLIG